jgi:hypothetical protein
LKRTSTPAPPAPLLIGVSDCESREPGVCRRIAWMASRIVLLAFIGVHLHDSVEADGCPTGFKADSFDPTGTYCEGLKGQCRGPGGSDVNVKIKTCATEGQCRAFCYSGLHSLDPTPSPTFDVEGPNCVGYAYGRGGQFGPVDMNNCQIYGFNFQWTDSRGSSGWRLEPHSTTTIAGARGPIPPDGLEWTCFARTGGGH